MLYQELNKQQKNIADNVEKIYIQNKVIAIRDFVTALGFVINKYKRLR